MAIYHFSFCNHPLGLTLTWNSETKETGAQIKDRNNVNQINTLNNTKLKNTEHKKDVLLCSAIYLHKLLSEDELQSFGLPNKATLIDWLNSTPSIIDVEKQSNHYSVVLFNDKQQKIKTLNEDYPQLSALLNNDCELDFFSTKKWVVDWKTIPDLTSNDDNETIPFLFEKKAHFNLFKKLPTEIIDFLIKTNSFIAPDDVRFKSFSAISLLIKTLSYLQIGGKEPFNLYATTGLFGAIKGMIAGLSLYYNHLNTHNNQFYQVARVLLYFIADENKPENKNHTALINDIDVNELFNQTTNYKSRLYGIASILYEYFAKQGHNDVMPLHEQNEWGNKIKALVLMTLYHLNKINMNTQTLTQIINVDFIDNLAHSSSFTNFNEALNANLVLLNQIHKRYFERGLLEYSIQTSNTSDIISNLKLEQTRFNLLPNDVKFFNDNPISSLFLCNDFIFVPLVYEEDFMLEGLKMNNCIKSIHLHGNNVKNIMTTLIETNKELAKEKFNIQEKIPTAPAFMSYYHVARIPKDMSYEDILNTWQKNRNFIYEKDFIHWRTSLHLKLTPNQHTWLNFTRSIFEAITQGVFQNDDYFDKLLFELDQPTFSVEVNEYQIKKQSGSIHHNIDDDFKVALLSLMKVMETANQFVFFNPKNSIY